MKKKGELKIVIREDVTTYYVIHVIYIEIKQISTGTRSRVQTSTNSLKINNYLWLFTPQTPTNFGVMIKEQ